MKSHITNEEQNLQEIQKTYLKHLEKARFDGIAIGSKTVSQIIYDKAIKANKENAMDIISDILRLCKVQADTKEE